MEVTDLSICRLVRSYARRLPQGFNGDEWTGAASMLPAPNGLLAGGASLLDELSLVAAATSAEVIGTPIATL